MKNLRCFPFLILLLFFSFHLTAATPVRNVLFIGDSMTGWMGERLQAYGADNGFEVATITWDGATIAKLAGSGRLPQFMAKYKPDMVVLNIGMNDMWMKNPEQRVGADLDKILGAVSGTPFLWIGPIEWPGREYGTVFNKWLKERVEATPGGHYFDASGVKVPRQSAKNPHPTRPGIQTLVDAVVEWLPATDLPLQRVQKPTGKPFQRGKVYIYRRNKEAL